MFTRSTPALVSVLLALAATAACQSYPDLNRNDYYDPLLIDAGQDTGSDADDDDDDARIKGGIIIDSGTGGAGNEGGAGGEGGAAPAVCGDGILDESEESDDSNTEDGDGCSAVCTIESVCGDGIVEGSEECDDGNNVSGDGCSSTCTVEPVCGDGVIEGNEQCDDGGTCAGGSNSTLPCETNSDCPGGSCQLPGSMVAGDGCGVTCREESWCGDGVIDAGEQCDDGGRCIGGSNDGALCTMHTECPGGTCTAVGGDGCTSNCTVEPE